MGKEYGVGYGQMTVALDEQGHSWLIGLLGRAKN
jgi:hypothetical protein